MVIRGQTLKHTKTTTTVNEEIGEQTQNNTSSQVLVRSVVSNAQRQIPNNQTSFLNMISANPEITFDLMTVFF
jgi:hypothetical protein